MMFRKLLLRALLRNELESLALRRLYKKWFDIEVGLYSYGAFDIKRIPAGARIGRYCSFAPTCHFFSRNHGIEYLALHPYLYNSQLGLVREDTISQRRFLVEDDVWVGHNVTVTAGATVIGRGSVLAAGAVVTKNVPRYAIVAGNPAQVIRYRFPENIIEKIEASQWWCLGKNELADLIRRNPEMCFGPRRFYEEN